MRQVQVLKQNIDCILYRLSVTKMW